ncbi:VWA domain-containing protein [Pontibacterium sp. N1Y112]|uniref:VWA domain-containing protein n=1 Tax=Pontibacterium sinense TaxID=2781979 RepID=A0A8J7FT61_9GAMM|nr:VWA domain-containing protein [Pontibacterium sinense]MBE9396810.1 VWA domain-containing protein [Pontibacterium sinense]
MKKFAAKSARPIPVIILADTSGSMSVDGKVDAMNQAIRGMIASFAEESRLNAEIHLSVITFGGNAETHLALTPAHQITHFEDFYATGGTPMGEALTIAKELIEDKEKISSRAYRPVIVLISDGHPTDDWEGQFSAFCSAERAQKATRMAMAIGSDADEVMMNDFINDLEAPLFRASNAQDIIKFFRAVSMSVTSRSRSTTPNQPVAITYDEIPEDDELDLDF